MNKGDTVIVRVHGGTNVERRVVASDGGIVLLCCDEEYVAAQAESRQPSCVGFPVDDILTPRGETNSE